ncbi:hypothetical protein PV408_48865, partial [Streptomyces sp. ME18-1-4]|nr:hypothetical protein [Streptomyces sp. ME18-1-4]
MASEDPPRRDTPRGDPSALERLSALLTAASGTAPTPRELAELLWLARELGGPEAEPCGKPSGVESAPPSAPPAPAAGATPADRENRPAASPPLPATQP